MHLERKFSEDPGDTEAGDVQSFILYIVDAVCSKTGRGVASAIVSIMKNYFLGDSNYLM